jgi:multidrug efflux system outer membrane protein
MRNTIAMTLLVLIMGACTVGPNYTRPDVDAPSTWRIEESEGKDLANTAWWEQFGDPVLNEPITTALQENKDLMIASASVQEYAGRLTTTRSELFPQIGYDAEASRDRSSERLATSPPPGVDTEQTTTSVVLNANWEIDLWGRIRRLSESARADLFAKEEARRGVVLSLVSSVATGYIQLRDYDRQLEIAKETAASRKETLKLFELRFKGGVISQVEVAQVRSQYEEAQAAIPDIVSSIAETENSLSILLGRNPGPIARGKTIEELTLFPVPAGLPSALLEQRPDILEAEQNLISANAQIGAARALYFPTISLTGLFGFTSEDLSDLFTGPSRTWSFGGSIIGPIFTFGQIDGQVQQAEAVQQQLLVTYEQTIQDAFREVDDALVSHRSSRERVASRKRQVEALQQYVRLSRLRYDNGYSGFLEVLDAERSLFDAELAYSQSQGDVFSSLISIYKAMGGGWVTEADRLTDKEPASTQQQ